MEKFDELLEKLQSLNITQTKSDWAEILPDEIWKEYFEGNFTEIAFNLDIDTHRWYETSVSVIKIYDRFLGIKYITNMFSESQDYEDCYVTMEFYEMKETQITTYTKK